MKKTKFLRRLMNGHSPKAGDTYINNLWATYCKETTPGERKKYKFEQLINQVLTQA